MSYVYSHCEVATSYRHSTPTGCSCLNTPFSIDISRRWREETFMSYVYSHCEAISPLWREEPLDVGMRWPYLLRLENR